MAAYRVNMAHRSFICMFGLAAGASMNSMNVSPNNGWNYELARARAAEVYKYLKDHLKVLGLVWHDPDTTGIQLAGFRHHRVGVENDDDRAVYVQITSDSTPPPRPPYPYRSR